VTPITVALVTADSTPLWAAILGWVFVVVLCAVMLYVLIGVLLLPVWGVGAALRAGGVARVGRGWWGLPLVALERSLGWGERLTAPRDGSRYARPDPPPTHHEQDWTKRLGSVLQWGLAVVGGMVALVYGHDSIIAPLAGGTEAADVAATTAAIGSAVVAGAVAWVLYQRYDDRRRPPLFRFCVGVAIVMTLLSYMLVGERSRATRLVHDYCAYGSVSNAQLHGCETHVIANEVRNRDTPAARFAAGDSTAVCGPGSGPYCEQVLQWRYAEAQAPPPGQ
jgi:hypothetical protein